MREVAGQLVRRELPDRAVGHLEPDLSVFCLLHHPAIATCKTLARQVCAELHDPPFLIASHLPRPFPRDGHPIEHRQSPFLAVQLSAHDPLALDGRIGGGAHGAARSEQESAVAFAFREPDPQLGSGFRSFGERHFYCGGPQDIKGPAEVPALQRLIQCLHLRRLRPQVLCDGRSREAFLLQQLERLACLDRRELARVAGKDQSRDVHAVGQFDQPREPVVADLRGFIDHDDRTGQSGPGLRHPFRAGGASQHPPVPAKEAVDGRCGQIELGPEVPRRPSRMGQCMHVSAIGLEQCCHWHERC